MNFSRKHWLFLGLSLVAASVLYWPLLRQLGLCDYDAMYLLAQIRQTGRFCGFFNGYFLSALIGIVNGCINLMGLAHNDYMLAYRFVIGVSALGIVAFSYALMARLGVNAVVAFVFTMLVAVTPGILQLIGTLEDNMNSSGTNMLYLTVFVLFAEAWRAREHSPRRYKVMSALLPVTLFLAVTAHHQEIVVLVTPAFLLWWMRDMPLVKRALYIGRIYMIFGVLFLALYVLLTIKWYYGWAWSSYAFAIKEWYVPNSVYREYYYFNRFGWLHFAEQWKEILGGWSQIVGSHPVDAIIPARYLAVFLISLLVIGPVRKVFRDDERLWIVALFVIVHIPHSLIFDSINIERWDAIIPPCVILFAVMADRARKSMFEKKWHIAPFGVAALFLVLLFEFDLRYYTEWVKMIDSNARGTKFRIMKHEFHKQVDPLRTASAKRSVLVFPKNDYDQLVSISATYFNWQDSIFAVDERGRILKSPSIYPQPKEISKDEFRKLTEGATFVENPITLPALKKIGAVQ